MRVYYERLSFVLSPKRAFLFLAERESRSRLLPTGWNSWIMGLWWPRCGSSANFDPPQVRATYYLEPSVVASTDLLATGRVLYHRFQQCLQSCLTRGAHIVKITRCRSTSHTIFYLDLRMSRPKNEWNLAKKPNFARWHVTPIPITWVRPSV
jgi:hypothetical protein